MCLSLPFSSRYRRLYLDGKFSVYVYGITHFACVGTIVLGSLCGEGVYSLEKDGALSSIYG